MSLCSSGKPPTRMITTITTITHDHAGRLHSYELLAKAWGT